jgi:hypothetical protein
MSARIAPLIAVGIPTFGTVSINWAQSFRHLGGLLGATIIDMTVPANPSAQEPKPIAVARNELMRQAIGNRCDYLFMLGDDVFAPGDAIHRLWSRMQDNPDVDLATGVYWTKTHPTHPYIWRDLQRGPYLDWRMGE